MNFTDETFIFKGKVPQGVQLQEDLDDDDDDSSNLQEPGEPPPYKKIKGQDNHNSILQTGYMKRYACHSCDGPDCSNPTICMNALSCWKSRVRDNTGRYILNFLLY